MSWDLTHESRDGTGKIISLYGHKQKRNNAERKPNMYQIGDAVLYRMKKSSFNANNISAKFLLKWFRHVIAKIVRPKVVLLSKPRDGS